MKFHLLAFAALISSCPAAEITVDPVNTLATGTSAWTETQWATAGNFENWTTSNITNSAVSGGVISGKSSSTAPQLSRTSIVGGPDLDLGFNDYVEIRMQLPATYVGNVEVDFGVTNVDVAAQTGFNATRMVTVPNAVIPKDGAYHTYRIDMGTVPMWRGTLTDLRIVPATVTNTNFAIDYVRIGDNPDEVYQRNTMDFGDNGAYELSSKHFRVIWDAATAASPGVTTTHARKMLRTAEEAWQAYVKLYGYIEANQSVNPAVRQQYPGKFKTNIICWYSGEWMGTSQNSFGYINIQSDFAVLTDYYAGALAHETMHVFELHQGGGFAYYNNVMGKWWEPHANYGQEIWYHTYRPGWTGADASFYRSSNLSHPHDYHKYHAWSIFQYLDENRDALPDLGMASGTNQRSFSARLWQESVSPEYIYETMKRLLPNTSIKDVLGYFARRQATFDYSNQADIQTNLNNQDPERTERLRVTDLVRRADDSTWWQPYAASLPMAYSYATHELVPIGTGAGRVVSVNLRGYVNPDLQSDWRAALVVVNDSGVTRYSSLWNSGSNSVTLAANENKVYLTVAATPGQYLIPTNSETEQPYISHPARERYPYEVQVTGATPKGNGTGGTLSVHANGGGYKSSTATVDAGAYIGPNARVLDYAIVRDGARVDDYAVVSGHALVRSGTVQGYARVREYATLDGCTISGNARIGGHAYLSGSTVSGNATVKGIGNQANNSVSGDAVMDGDNFTNNSASNGFHFGHDWAGFINTSAPAALFASYQFPTAHPYAAKDQYGATDGLLVGSPAWNSTDGARSGFLTFNGSGQYVLLSRWVNDLRVGTFSARVKWAGGAANQAIFHFGDGTATTQMVVTPSNASGKCELNIKKGATTVSIPAASALPIGSWKLVSVVLDGVTASFYLDNSLAGSAACTLRPEDLLPANTNETPAHNFLAHGTGMADFNGSIDDFTAHSAAIPGGVAVSVAALSTDLPEIGNTTSYRISRVALDPASIQQPLTVTYTMSGTATSGTDYIRPTGTVTIPANALYADVAITSIPDATTESTETIILTLNDTSSYDVVGTAATASINLLDRGTDMATFSSSLLAWYKLNETTGTTAADSSTKGKTATLYNGPVWNTGESALTFDGADDYVQTPVTNGTTRTLSAWIRPHDASAWADDANVFNAHVAGLWGTGWGVRNGQIYVMLDDTDYDSGVAITSNVWQHVSLAFNTTQARLYVNGQLRHTQAYTQGGVSTTATYRIGHSTNTDFSGVYFDGDIRQAMIYNKAVTNAEALSIFSGQITTPSAAPTNLVATAGSASVTLSWTASGSGETMYYIGRSTTPGGPYVYIAQVSGGSTSFTDTGVTPNTPYYYVVTGAANGGTSPASTQSSAVPYPEPGNGIWISSSAGNWSLPTNWQGNVVGGGTDKTATFNLATGVTVTLDSARSLGGLNFANGNYTISGSALTLDVSAGTPVVSVAGSATATITSALVGTDGLTKTDTGTLVLNAGSGDYAGTYIQNISGGLTINAGTVSLASQKIRFGSVTIDNGATLKSTASWATGASNPWFNGASVGAITVNAGGTLTATSSANGIVQGLTLNGGTVSAPGVSDANWGAFTIGSTVTASGAATSAISAELAVTGVQTFSVGTDSTLNISGVMHNRNSASAGGITKSGSGTLTLSAANTYTGTTTVAGGTLVLNSPSGAKDYKGGTLSLNGASTLRINGQAYTFNGKTFVFDSAGGGTIDAVADGAGGLYFTGDNTFRTSGGVPNTFSGAGSGNQGLNLNGKTATFDVAVGSDPNVANLNISGKIWNSGGITKTGPGTLAISGTNTYSGATTVSAGTLVVDTTGALANTSTLTLADGTTCELRNTAGAVANSAHVYLNGTGKLTIASGVAQTVARLYVDNVLQPATTFTSTSHPALVSGSGSLIVTEGPPAAPTSLSAIPISANAVNLSWTDHATNETGYLVERSTTSGSGFVQVASLAAGTTSWSDSGLAPNTTYVYQVRATNTTFGNSTYSAEATATTLIVPLVAPTGLTTTAGDSQVALSWSTISGATSYHVQRTTVSGGPYETMASPTEPNFTDSTVTNGTTYYYVVSAVNAETESANSTEASARPLPPVGNGVWTSTTDGNWSLEDNWQNFVIASGADKTATFSQGGGVTVTLDGARTLGGLNFANANTTLTGNAITLATSSGTPTIAVGPGVTATLASSLGGSSGLAVTGPGMLALTTAPTYSGATSITGATLSNAAAAGTSFSLNALAMNGATLAAANAGAASLGNFQLRSDVTVGGSVQSVISADVRVIQNETRTFNVGTTGDASGTDLLISGRLGHQNNVAWGYAIKSGPGTMKISGANEIGSMTVNAGKLILEDTGIGGMWNGSLTNHAQTELCVTAGTASYPDRTIYGNGTYTKTGPGVLNLLSFSNSPNVVVENGRLHLTGGHNNFWAVETTAIRSGAVLSNNTHSHIKALTLDGGELASTGTDATWGSWMLDQTVTVTGSGTSVISAQRVAIANASHVSRIFDVAASATLNLSGTFENAATTTANGLTKTGEGKMVLSGANTYDGATIVNGGTLAVNSATSASSAVSVGGASATGMPTLTGTGAVNGSVTINAASGGAAGTLNPGAVGTTGQISTGSATIHGTLVIDLDAASADKLVVSGNLAIAAATLDINTISAPTAASYDLASYTGSLDATAFASVKNLPPGYQLGFDATNKLIKLVQSISAYDSWATTSYGLSGADAAFDADPDGDGLANGLEWILGGNPGVSSESIAPSAARDASGNFIVTFTRLETSIAETTLRLEYGSDLSTWPGQILIGPASSGPDANGVSISIDTTVSPDEVKVTIPPVNSPGGRIFTRLKASK